MLNLLDSGKEYQKISECMIYLCLLLLKYRFVTFDNNNRFQDRELKSIKIQADCEYIRLVVKGCHQNRLNVHKQVRELQKVFSVLLPG